MVAFSITWKLGQTELLSFCQGTEWLLAPVDEDAKNPQMSTSGTLHNYKNHSFLHLRLVSFSPSRCFLHPKAIVDSCDTKMTQIVILPAMRLMWSRLLFLVKERNVYKSWGLHIDTDGTLLLIQLTKKFSQRMYELN